MWNCLLMDATWTNYIQVESFRSKNQGVIGEAIANYLGMLGYFDKVEIAYDSEPVLAAGVKMAGTIRANFCNLESSMIRQGQLWQKEASRQSETRAKL